MLRSMNTKILFHKAYLDEVKRLITKVLNINPKFIDMKKKIRSYLMRHSEISFYKKSDTNSEYFKVGNSKIRLSDHINPINNQLDQLNIIINNNNFVVILGNKMIINNDYVEFKKFLKYYIQTCDCFKDIFKYVTFTRATQEIKWGDKRIDVSDLKQSQYIGLLKQLNFGSIKKEKQLMGIIELFRAQNEQK